MGLRSDHVRSRSYAPVGQPPVTGATGQSFGCNMISAITNKGALSFMVFQGRFRAPVFVQFLTRLIKSLSRRIYLIVDGHSAHRAAIVLPFIARHARRL